MELKKLEYLESVYRLRSFTKAAKERYISQPSVSGAVKSLEEELGIDLIVRDTHPLSFTPNGELFMKYVYQILGAVEEAENAAAYLRLSQKPALKVALYYNIDNPIFSPLYMKFSSQFSQYDLLLREMPEKDMLNFLFSGDLDLAYLLIPAYTDLSSFEILLLKQSQLFAVLPKRHPLADCEAISFQQLEREQLLTFPEGSTVRDALDEKFEENSVSPKIISISKTVSMLEMIEQGYGIGFNVGYNESLRKNENVAIRPLREPIYFQIGLVLKRGRAHTPAIQAIMDFLMEIKK